MQAKHWKATFRIARLAPLFVAVSMLASCGGDGDDTPSPAPTPAPPPPNSNLIIGTSHGDLAPYLTERLGLVATAENFSGSADSLGDVILLSAPNGLSAAHASLPMLQDAFEQGKAVALVHADEGEISTLLMALGMDMNYPPQDDGTPYELFAARRAGGDTHFFVTLGGEGAKPVSPTMTEYTITIEGPEDNPTNVQVHEEEVPTPLPEVDEGVAQGVRADNFARWVEETRQKAQAKAGVKADAPVAADPTADLRKVGKTLVHNVDLSDMGQSFVIRYTINAVHNFTNDLDYYFVTQSATLNPKPSGLWRWIWHGSCWTYTKWQDIETDRPLQVGQMRHYFFKNYWGADPGNAEPLPPLHSPGNASNLDKVTSDISYRLDGTLGIGGSSSIYGGVTYSNSAAFDSSDVTVSNQAGSDDRKHQAAWQYTFANPSADGPIGFLWCWFDLEEAPKLSHETFQPVNQWVWTVPSGFSETQNSFKAEFNWTNGASFGQSLYCRDAQCKHRLIEADHRDWLGRTKVFWVPIDEIRPPLLVTSESSVRFPRSGGSKEVKVVSARGGVAHLLSPVAWLRAEKKPVSGTDPDNFILHITATPNDSGADRSAAVWLISDKHRKMILVHQSAQD